AGATGAVGAPRPVVTPAPLMQPATRAAGTEPCGDEASGLRLETEATAEAAGPASMEAGAIETSGSTSEPTPEDELRIWELPGERVATVDSTGAGDAFVGALAAAIAEGRPLAEAVRRAVAAGALATTHNGAREGMPTALELEEFLATR
ncbi:MAG TPA: carbohydrate kinase family protein, partial [Candidatus Limnocylindrales bacterium]